MPIHRAALPKQCMPDARKECPIQPHSASTANDATSATAAAAASSRGPPGRPAAPLFVSSVRPPVETALGLLPLLEVLLPAGAAEGALAGADADESEDETWPGDRLCGTETAAAA